jgi:hypothetical protein
MAVNFSHEEIELPKATLLGVAEETSASVVVAINDEEAPGRNDSAKTRRGVNTVVDDSWFKQYLQDKLGHLTQAEKSVLEPVLVKYRNVFHREENNDFRGTDLVEHIIVTGDAKPIRKSSFSSYVK